MAHDSDEARAAAAALASLPHMGPRRLEALVRRHGYAGAWAEVLAGRALRSRSVRAALGSEADEVASRWRAAAQRTDPAAVLAAHVAAGIEVIPLGADRYPAVLAADHQRPMVLFARGDLGRLGPPRVAVVGTRRATNGGRQTAREWGRALAEAGVQVVSGLALGIDGAAHLGALEGLDSGVVDAAPPLGVVGTGLDVVYPRRHASLWERIAADGVLVSEVPLGGTPTRWRFPARNRIIAAFADVVVVVESHARGGALSTAVEAGERGRPVLAVPGSIRTPAAAGTNRLLVDGAAPACTVEDVLLHLDLSGCERLARSDRTDGEDAAAGGPLPAGTSAAAPLDEVDRALLGHLGTEPVPLDDLAVLSNLPLGQLSVRLLDLEGRGLVVRRGSAVERAEH